MFKKKKKKQQVEETEQVTLEETEAIEPLPIDPEPKEPITNRDNPASFFDFSTKEEPVENQPVGDEVISVVVGEEDWQWSNTEEYEIKLEKENKKIKKKRKKETEEPEERTKEKKELSTFFEEGKDKTEKLRRKDKKALKRAETEKKQRSSKKEKLQEDIKNQKVFRYDGKKYTKVEEFITYLNQHYLDIETIAEEVLEDENFFGWINKNSGVFPKSLKEYKEIQAKIENKS